MCTQSASSTSRREDADHLYFSPDSLWDVADDAFFAKQNPCCPALHFEAMPRLSPAGWTILYVVVSLLIFVGFILAALATWKQSPHAMYCQVSCPFHIPPVCSSLTKRGLLSRNDTGAVVSTVSTIPFF